MRRASDGSRSCDGSCGCGAAENCWMRSWPLRERLQGLAKAEPEGFVDGVEQAVLDPFHGYANAIHNGLPDAAAVLYAFHVVQLGTQVVDEARRRVQQDTRPLRRQARPAELRSAGYFATRAEQLTEKQQAKIS